MSDYFFTSLNNEAIFNSVWFFLHRIENEGKPNEYANPNKFFVMVTLILSARRSDGEDLKRGQIFFGSQKAQRDWGLPASTIRNVLKSLESMGEIKIEDAKSRKGRSVGKIITVVRYDEFIHKSGKGKKDEDDDSIYDA